MPVAGVWDELDDILPPVQSDFPVQPFFPLQPLEPVQSDFPVQPLVPLQVVLPLQPVLPEQEELPFFWLSPIDDPQAQPPTELPMARPIKANLSTFFFIASLPKMVYTNYFQEIMKDFFCQVEDC
jgi:hypothetical protein